MAFSFTVRGEKKVERALGNLDEDGEKALKKEKSRLAKNLAARLRRAVISGSKTTMGRRVRPTIRQTGDTVKAGPHPMLMGTEWGMNRKSGWYAYPQYRHSTALQFKPHGGGGYWWTPTIQRSKPEAEAAVRRALDDTLGHWSA